MTVRGPGAGDAARAQAVTAPGRGRGRGTPLVELEKDSEDDLHVKPPGLRVSARPRTGPAWPADGPVRERAWPSAAAANGGGTVIGPGPEPANMDRVWLGSSR